MNIEERLIAAYADDHLAAPVSAIRTRVVRRRVRWSAVGAALAVDFISGTALRPAPAAPAFDTFDTQCAAAYGSALSSPRLVLTQGDSWLRVYLAGPMLVSCERRPDGLVTSAALVTSAVEVADRYPANRSVQFFDSAAAVEKRQPLVARAPLGTVRVTVDSRDGVRVAAGLVDDIVVAWSLRDSLASAVVTAYGPSGVLASAVASASNGGPFDPVAFGAMCQRRAMEVLRTATALTDEQRSVLPPLRFTLREGDMALWVYANGRVILPCQHTPSEDVRLDSAYVFNSAPEPTELRAMVMHAGEAEGWVIGQAPTNTISVEVVLVGGVTVPATLNMPFFVARWTGASGLPVQVVARTPVRVYRHDVTR
jgi:hypothetical protein